MQPPVGSLALWVIWGLCAGVADSITGLAGMELSCTVACMVLCFRYVTKIMLVTRYVLGITEKILQSVRACSVSHSAPPVNEIGSAQEFVKGRSQAGTQNNQRDIPCHTTPHWAMKKGRSEV